VEARPPRPLRPKVGVARLRGGMSEDCACRVLRGGRATTNAESREFPLVESREPACGGNKGGMTREVG
jgi:hypothetical protein